MRLTWDNWPDVFIFNPNMLLLKEIKDRDFLDSPAFSKVLEGEEIRMALTESVKIFFLCVCVADIVKLSWK